MAHPLLRLYKKFDLNENPSRYLPKLIGLGSLTFPAPEDEDFVELLLLYICGGLSCFFLEAISVFLLETTLSDSHALHRNVASSTCQFLTTSSTMLSAF